MRDVRYGFRLIGRARGFALVVVTTLALVIGANATVFSVMHAVLWRPLPYPSPDRLVVVDADFGGVRQAGISGAEASDLSAERDLFDGLAQVVPVDAHVTVEGEMDDISGVGQTQAAHDLCVNIPDDKRVHYLQPKVGHYGVFNGSRFRAEIQPRISDFMVSLDMEAAKERRDDSAKEQRKALKVVG